MSDFDNGKLNWREFKIDKIFEINNTLSFNKNELTSGDGYDYVTRTSKNQGVLQRTGFVNSENINPSGNWSLGLLQMDFFYRSKPWYAGQFVRKINLNIKVTKNENLYFTVVLNKLKEKLLTVLVRDIDKTFLNSRVQLPLLENNEIDHIKIDNLISAIQKLVIKDVILSVDKKIDTTKNVIKE
ncbi:MAG: restriction endonuclease subunit S [Flavobacteriaceae bacterium]